MVVLMEMSLRCFRDGACGLPISTMTLLASVSFHLFLFRLLAYCQQFPGIFCFGSSFWKGHESLSEESSATYVCMLSFAGRS